MPDPQAATEVEAILAAEWHEDQCACSLWPASCVYNLTSPDEWPVPLVLETWSRIGVAARKAETVGLQTVLSSLRSVDHHELDAKYDLESTWRDLMEVIHPLAALHRLAASGVLRGRHWDTLRDLVLEPSQAIVEHYTSGPPDYTPAFYCAGDHRG